MAYKQIFGRDDLRNENISALTNGGDTPVTNPVPTDPTKKKDPKSTSTTTTTSVKGIDPNIPGSKRKGTIFTDTVTTITDGVSGGKKPGAPTGPTQPFNNPALPNQTYQEFLDAEPGSPGKPVKPTKTPNTPGSTSTTSTTRFVPDLLAMPTTLDSYGINTQTPEIKTNLPGISLGVRADIPKYYHHRGSNAPNMEFGGHTTTSNTTSPDGGFQASYTNSPSKTISGKSNTTSSIPFTQAQNVAMYAGFPMGQDAPPSDEVANAFVNKKREKVLVRANKKYNKRYNKQ